jgi:hypothetical protein
MKAKWIGQVSRRDCFLKHVIDRKIEEEVTEGRRRRSKQSLERNEKIVEAERGSTVS